MSEERKISLQEVELDRENIGSKNTEALCEQINAIFVAVNPHPIDALTALLTMTSHVRDQLCEKADAPLPAISIGNGDTGFITAIFSENVEESVEIMRKTTDGLEQCLSKGELRCTTKVPNGTTVQ